METTSENFSLMLIGVIVNFGSGSGVVKIAKQNGVSGGTILLGKGTASSHFLNVLGLSDIRKEIVLMITNESTGYSALEQIDKNFHFQKPSHGIAFTMPIASAFGISNCTNKNNLESCGVNTGMYHSIIIIVDKGTGESAVEIATKAGARGGTIINARGSGTNETSKLFQMEIEPEKEVVLILSKNVATEGIVSALRDQLEIDKNGSGVIFVQDVSKTYGLQ